MMLYRKAGLLGYVAFLIMPHQYSQSTRQAVAYPLRPATDTADSMDLQLC